MDQHDFNMTPPDLIKYLL